MKLLAKRITKNMCLFSLCIISLILLILGINYWNQKEDAKPSHRIPIVIINNKNNSHKAMKTVLKRDGAPEAIEVKINQQNDFSIKHNHRIHGPHPVIGLNFQKNFTGNKSETIIDVINYVHSKYHYHKFDSIGFDQNSLSLYTAFTSQKLHSKIKLKRFISIASDYKSIDFTKPNNQLADDVKVLNIFGQINKHTQSDGVVLNKNTQKLKNSVSDTDNYQEISLKGKAASHETIVRNPILFRIISRFIFDD